MYFRRLGTFGVGAAPVLLGLTINSPVFALDGSWLCGSDDWSTPSCWISGAPPSTGAWVYLTQSDATDRTVYYQNAPYANLGHVYIDATGTGQITLSQSNDSFLANTEYIGFDGRGSYSQSGGTNTVTFMYFGENATGNGSYNLSGGTLDAAVQIIGRNGSGSFVQTSGLNSAWNNFVLGMYGGSSGSYSMSGTSRLETSTASVGYSGSGSVNQSGGTHIVGRALTVGVQGSANGSYTLSDDGNLTVGTGITVGNSGTGSFVQHSGTVNVSDYVAIGSSVGSTGSYTLHSGSLNTDRAIIGHSGTGSFIQTGGTHTINTDLTMGVSTYYNPYIPKLYVGDGNYTLTGGTLSVNGRIVNGPGNSTLTIDGGTLNAVNVDVDALNIGLSSGSIGQHSLSNGESISASEETIGGQGTGVFTQTGGIHQVGQLTMANQSGANGTYNLQGGSLSAGTIDADNPDANFNFSGGTLSVANYYGTLVNGGGTLAPGASPGITSVIGDYIQSDSGTLSIDIGGLLTGTEYDVLNVSNTVSLDGILGIDLLDLGSGLFTPSQGDSFDILSADSIFGSFDTLAFAALGNGLTWDISYLIDEIGSTDVVRLTAVTAVPLPASIWLFAGGLLALLRVSKKHKAA